MLICVRVCLQNKLLLLLDSYSTLILHDKIVERVIYFNIVQILQQPIAEKEETNRPVETNSEQDKLFAVFNTNWNIYRQELVNKGLTHSVTGNHLTKEK